MRGASNANSTIVHLACIICVGHSTHLRSLFFFFTATATTEIYTLSLHDALPISSLCPISPIQSSALYDERHPLRRSEEHTSELQSRGHLVCRLLLEKKKQREASLTISPACPTSDSSRNGAASLTCRLHCSDICAS